MRKIIYVALILGFLVGAFFAIYLSRLLFYVIECPDVVQTSGVVFMVVGQEDGIHSGYAFAEHLLSEVGAGIYKHLETFVFHIDACPESFVTRVGAPADFASASYHRHTLLCPCS